MIYNNTKTVFETVTCLSGLRLHYSERRLLVAVNPTGAETLIGNIKTVFKNRNETVCMLIYLYVCYCQV